VVEQLVEGGMTRFFAIFQSHDSPLVGPVRSARPVDAALLRQLGGGLFGYTGAAAGEIAPVPGGLHRDPGGGGTGPARLLPGVQPGGAAQPVHLHRRAVSGRHAA
jgi:hypothetical protein